VGMAVGEAVAVTDPTPSAAGAAPARHPVRDRRLPLVAGVADPPDRSV